MKQEVFSPLLYLEVDAIVSLQIYINSRFTSTLNTPTITSIGIETPTIVNR